MTSAQLSPVELAGAPPLNTDATGHGERISGIDVLRGFSLLGILMLNIDDFGGTRMSQHDIPLATIFYGPHGWINYLVFCLKWIFFEGKMRGIFSMLFGAGVLLLTMRAERRGAASAANVADIFTRRNLYLMLFGLLHGLFIWRGDILFIYGFAALLFLYPVRRLKPSTLLWTGTVMGLLLGTYIAFVFIGGTHDLSLKRQADAAAIAVQHQLPLNEQQKSALAQWQQRAAIQHVTPTAPDKDASAGGYWRGVAERADGFIGMSFARRQLWAMPDCLSAMLIGMALLQLGFLTAELSTRTYLLLAFAGLGLSTSIYSVGLEQVYRHGFPLLEQEGWFFLMYYLTRETGMIGLASLVMLTVKRGLFARTQQFLAAVGRTAFSNYILTSLLCQTLFVWGPLKLYGRLEYYQLMYVVAAVWVVNLLASRLWLRYFEFGPLEWGWRSLTYLRWQPMRLSGSYYLITSDAAIVGQEQELKRGRRA
jgi:uncharacterized protein